MHNTRKRKTMTSYDKEKKVTLYKEIRPIFQQIFDTIPVHCYIYISGYTQHVGKYLNQLTTFSFFLNFFPNLVYPEQVFLSIIRLNHTRLFTTQETEKRCQFMINKRKLLVKKYFQFFSKYLRLFHSTITSISHVIRHVDETIDDIFLFSQFLPELGLSRASILIHHTSKSH